MHDGNLDKITTEMMEYICDSLCKYPEMESDEETQEELCADCKMGKFVCDILNHRKMAEQTKG